MRLLLIFLAVQAYGQISCFPACGGGGGGSTVTSVTATLPLTSSGGSTPNIASPLPVGTTLSGTTISFPGNVAIGVTVLDPVRGMYNVPGAVCDGSTDIYTPLNTAIVAAAAGSTILIPQNCVIFQTLYIARSDITLASQGPTAGSLKLVPSGSDSKVLAIQGSMGSPQTITGAIAIGATSFTSTSGAATVAAGDWIEVRESDATLGGIITTDWMQVLSSSGTTVTTTQPFRTAFAGTHSGVVFVKITTQVFNVVIRNLQLTTSVTATSVAGLYISVARHVKADMVKSTVSGNGFYGQESSDITITNSLSTLSPLVGSEIASCVDVNITNSRFYNDSTTAVTAGGLTLDLGTAFFSVSGNTLFTGKDSMVQMTHGVHDGTFTGNTLGYVPGNGNGITAVGCQRVMAYANILVGGAGTGKGISFGNDAGTSPTIASSANWIGPNEISNFSAPFGTQSTADTYTVLGANKIGFGGTPHQPIDVVGSASASASAAIQLTDTAGPAGSRNWLIGNSSGLLGYGILGFFVGPSNGANPSGTASATILANGNFGIGSAVQGSKLTVVGGDAFVATVGSGVIVTDSAGACWRIVPTVTTGVLTSTTVTCPAF